MKTIFTLLILSTMLSACGGGGDDVYPVAPAASGPDVPKPQPIDPTAAR